MLFPVNQLLVKNDYILPLDIYRHYKTNISPNWRDIENLGNRSLKKSQMVYPFRQIILPTALEQPISKTHQFWEEFGRMEKFSRDSNISLPSPM